MKTCVYNLQWHTVHLVMTSIHPPHLRCSFQSIFHQFADPMGFGSGLVRASTENCSFLPGRQDMSAPENSKREGDVRGTAVEGGVEWRVGGSSEILRQLEM